MRLVLLDLTLSPAASSTPFSSYQKQAKSQQAVAEALRRWAEGAE